MTASLAMRAELSIERLGQRGEGIARGDGGLVFVPYALPGDTIIAETDGDRGRLVEIVNAGAGRITPICRYYTICGGCAVQALAPAPYQQWKRSLVAAALDHAGITAPVEALVDAHGEGRRRATFHARMQMRGLREPSVEVGFMQARAHTIVNIDHCPILVPELNSAIVIARAIATAVASLERPLDLVFTASLDGIDVDLHGLGAIEPASRDALVAVAERHDLARLSNHGDILIERRAPLLRIGSAMVAPPPGVFLQATVAGEQTLGALVKQGVGKAKRIADLFAGVGTFTLPLAERAEVHAVELDADALAALARAANRTSGMHGVSTETRDLFKRPLLAGELAAYDAIVFDPPRAGAMAQAQILAASEVPIVVGVSCAPQTFARDAKILIDGGYVLDRVTPVDQFRYSPHVELVGTFTKKIAKAKRRPRLLG